MRFSVFFIVIFSFTKSSFQYGATGGSGVATIDATIKKEVNVGYLGGTEAAGGGGGGGYLHPPVQNTANAGKSLGFSFGLNGNHGHGHIRTLINKIHEHKQNRQNHHGHHGLHGYGVHNSYGYNHAYDQNTQNSFGLGFNAQGNGYKPPIPPTPTPANEPLPPVNTNFYGTGSYGGNNHHNHNQQPCTSCGGGFDSNSNNGGSSGFGLGTTFGHTNYAEAGNQHNIHDSDTDGFITNTESGPIYGGNKNNQPSFNTGWGYQPNKNFNQIPNTHGDNAHGNTHNTAAVGSATNWNANNLDLDQVFGHNTNGGVSSSSSSNANSNAFSGGTNIGGNNFGLNAGFAGASSSASSSSISHGNGANTASVATASASASSLSNSNIVAKPSYG